MLVGKSGAPVGKLLSPSGKVPVGLPIGKTGVPVGKLLGGTPVPKAPGLGKTAGLTPGKGAPLTPRAGPAATPKPVAPVPFAKIPAIPRAAPRPVPRAVPRPVPGRSAGNLPPAKIPAKIPDAFAGRARAGELLRPPPGRVVPPIAPKPPASVMGAPSAAMAKTMSWAPPRAPGRAASHATVPPPKVVKGAGPKPGAQPGAIPRQPVPARAPVARPAPPPGPVNIARATPPKPPARAPPAASAARGGTVPPPSGPPKSPPPPAGWAPKKPAGDGPTPVDLVYDPKSKSLNLHRADGKKVVLGKTAGEGSSSRAFDVPVTSRMRGPDDLGQVAKLTEHGTATALDDLGRNVVESIDNPKVIQTPKVVKQYNVRNSPLVPPSRADVSPKDFTGGTLTFMEKAPPSFKDFPANLKMADGTMTPGQAAAFNRGMGAINKKGFVWLDNKYDNFTFKPLGDPKADKWVLVVLDPGGMLPMKATKGTTAAQKAASRIENARAMQRTLDNPPDEVLRVRDQYKAPMHKNVLSRDFDNVVNWEALRNITNNKDLGTLQSFVKGAPDKAKHFPYNPSRTGMNSGKLGSLISGEKVGKLSAAEDALRAAHKLPDSFASDISGVFKPSSKPGPGTSFGGPPPKGFDVGAPTAGLKPPPSAAGKSFRSAPTEVIPP